MQTLYDIENTEEVIQENLELYHYTTADGLWGILDANQENGFKNVLWATHYQHLNDLKELVLFRDILFERLVPQLLPRLQVLEEMKIPELEQELRKYTNHLEMAAFQANAHLNSLYRSNVGSHGAFITSFCARPDDEYERENGLLSLWRGYGKSGGAIIVFNTKALTDCLQDDVVIYANSWSAGKVLYDNKYSDLPSKLQGDIDTIAKAFTELYPAHTEQKISYSEDWFNSAIRSFYSSVWKIKHRSFSEEREVRFVATPAIFDEERIAWGLENKNTQIEKPIFFRKKDNELTPYIKLSILRDGKLPINRIIIGPHPNQDARAASAQAMVAKYGIPVMKSEIPLRW